MSGSAAITDGDHGSAGHVALHRHHRLAGLDRETAAVEGDALADQHDVLGLAHALGGLVVELHEARRDRGGLADADDAAEAALGELLLVEDGGLEPGRLRRGDGLLGQPGGGLDVGGHAGQQPRLPARARGGDGATADRVDRSSSVSVRQSTILPTGRSLGPSLCSEKPNEPRVAPCTNAAIPSSSATAETEEATASAFVVRRARVAPARRRSVGVAVADTDHQHARRGTGLGRSAVLTTGSSVTSPVSPVASAATSTSSRSCRGRRPARRHPGRGPVRPRPAAPATATTADPDQPRGGERR